MKVEQRLTTVIDRLLDGMDNDTMNLTIEENVLEAITNIQIAISEIRHDRSEILRIIPS